MSYLAKRLAVLFLLLAMMIIISVSLASGLNLVTVIKRVLIGGLIFSIIGGISGQLLSYSLNSSESSEKQEIKKVKEEKTVEEDNEEMVPLNFAKLNEDQSNVINQSNKEAEKAAQVLRSMKEDD